MFVITSFISKQSELKNGDEMDTCELILTCAVVPTVFMIIGYFFNRMMDSALRKKKSSIHLRTRRMSLGLGPLFFLKK
jgi:hypothetical protein